MVNNRPQVDKFKDMVRELEAGEDEAAFKEKVRKVANATRPENEHKE